MAPILLGLKLKMTISGFNKLQRYDVFCNMIHFVKTKNNTWILTMIMLYFKFCIVALLHKYDGSDLTWIENENDYFLFRYDIFRIGPFINIPFPRQKIIFGF